MIGLNKLSEEYKKYIAEKNYEYADIYIGLKFWSIKKMQKSYRLYLKKLNLPIPVFNQDIIKNSEAIIWMRQVLMEEISI